MITINKIEDAPNNSKVIIRAHGELKETYDRAKEKNLEILDLTCGKIKAIRVKISKKLEDHYIIIIGKKNHPESLGVLSFSGDNSNIIEDKEDINEIIDKVNNSLLNKIYIVSQTTFNSDKFDELISIIKNKTTKEVIVDKTICDATSKRQNETRELSFGQFAIVTKNEEVKEKLASGMKSKDIGEYNTCPHLCEYCYANSSKESAIANWKCHKTNPCSETITGK